MCLDALPLFQFVLSPNRVYYTPSQVSPLFACRLNPPMGIPSQPLLYVIYELNVAASHMITWHARRITALQELLSILY